MTPPATRERSSPSTTSATRATRPAPPTFRRWPRSKVSRRRSSSTPPARSCTSTPGNTTPRGRSTRTSAPTPTNESAQRRSRTSSPGCTVAGFSFGFSCSSVTMLMPVLAAIEPNDWPGRTSQNIGPGGLRLGGSGLGRIPPQVEALSGRESERIGVRVVGLEQIDRQAGLRGDLRERVPRSHRPVRRQSPHGRGTYSMSARRAGEVGGRADDERDCSHDSEE